MDKICKNCKWWYQWESTEKWHGACMLAESHVSDLASSEDELEPTYPQTKAMAFTSGDVSAYLFTTPDFGCNQWEGQDM